MSTARVIYKTNADKTRTVFVNGEYFAYIAPIDDGIDDNRWRLSGRYMAVKRRHKTLGEAKAAIEQAISNALTRWEL